MTKTKVPGITLGGDYAGTSLLGYMEASYRDLVRVLGKPNAEGDQYKVSTEWVVTFAGRTFTIYDYKVTRLYDRGGISVKAFRALPKFEWHIGGTAKDMTFEQLRSVILHAIAQLPAETPKPTKTKHSDAEEVSAKELGETIYSMGHDPDVDECVEFAAALLKQYKVVRK